MSEQHDDDVFPVVVVGGGLAGLTAAIHLAKRDIPPLVLEADSLWAGGRLAGGEPNTFEYAGRTWSFTTEHGMHALWGNYINMHALFDRFLDIHLQPSVGEEWINRWGRDVRYMEAGNAVRSRWIPAPFHYLQLLFNPNIWANITPLDFLSLPGLLASILLTVGFDPIKEQAPLHGLKMKDYFLGWTPNLRATFTGLGVNLLAAHAEDISLSGFIAAVRFYTMLRRDSWYMEYFTADSHNAIIQPLIDAIEAAGGYMMYGTEAVALEKDGENWRVIVEDSRAGGRRSLIAKHVILAVEPPAAERILKARPGTRDAANTIVFPSTVGSMAVRLWFDNSPRDGTPGGMMTGEFIPDNFFWLHRLYDEYAEWHEVTGGSIIELHIYPTNKQAEQSDQTFLIHALDAVYHAFPSVKGHFVHGAVRRNLRTQPVFEIPIQGRSLFTGTPWPGIHACGDWVGYDTPSMWMERSVITGIAAANQVITDFEAEPYPIIPPPKPEILVRILEVVVRASRRILGPLLVPMFRFFRRLRGHNRS